MPFLRSLTSLTRVLQRKIVSCPIVKGKKKRAPKTFAIVTNNHPHMTSVTLILAFFKIISLIFENGNTAELRASLITDPYPDDTFLSGGLRRDVGLNTRRHVPPSRRQLSKQQKNRCVTYADRIRRPSSRKSLPRDCIAPYNVI